MLSRARLTRGGSMRRASIFSQGGDSRANFRRFSMKSKKSDPTPKEGGLLGATSALSVGAAASRRRRGSSALLGIGGMDPSRRISGVAAAHMRRGSSAAVGVSRGIGLVEDDHVDHSRPSASLTLANPKWQREAVVITGLFTALLLGVGTVGDFGGIAVYVSVLSMVLSALCVGGSVVALFFVKLPFLYRISFVAILATIGPLASEARMSHWGSISRLLGVLGVTGALTFHAMWAVTSVSLHVSKHQPTLLRSAKEWRRRTLANDRGNGSFSGAGTPEGTGQKGGGGLFPFEGSLAAEGIATTSLPGLTEPAATAKKRDERRKRGSTFLAVGAVSGGNWGGWLADLAPLARMAENPYFVFVPLAAVVGIILASLTSLVTRSANSLALVSVSPPLVPADFLAAGVACLWGPCAWLLLRQPAIILRILRPFMLRSHTDTLTRDSGVVRRKWTDHAEAVLLALFHFSVLASCSVISHAGASMAVAASLYMGSDGHLVPARWSLPLTTVAPFLLFLAIIPVARVVVVHLRAVLNAKDAECSNIGGQLERTVEEMSSVMSELEDARGIAADAEKSIQEKAVFLASLSHELRTAMNSILGMTGLLQDTGLHGEQAEFVEAVERSSSSLMTLIEDVVSFTRAQTGDETATNVSFDVIEVVEGVLDSVESHMGGKDVDLHCFVHPRVPLRVKGDHRRIRQVISHILSNAAKFTHKGSVVVSVDVVPDQTNVTPADAARFRAAAAAAEDFTNKGSRKKKRKKGDPVEPVAAETFKVIPEMASEWQEGRPLTLSFSVKDTGIGIARKDLTRIFLPFQQLNVDTGDDRGGLSGVGEGGYRGCGMGLALCDQLAQLMSGDITVATVVGKGSTFSLTVPLEAGAAPSPPPRSSLHPRDEFHLSALLVAGESPSTKGLDSHLTAMGAEVSTVTSFPEALRRMRGAAASSASQGPPPPEVMFCDVNTLSPDSLQQLAQLPPRFARIPLVLMGSVSQQKALPDTFTSRMCGFLVRPLRRASLVQQLERACLQRLTGQRRGANVGVGSPSLSPTSPGRLTGVGSLDSGSSNGTPEVTGPPPLHILIAEDNVINQKVLRSILAKAFHTCDIVSDGAAAVEAVAKKEYDLVFMDIYMPPGMNGMAASKEIRRRERHSLTPNPLPIIALSADALAGTEESCLDAGMDSYISKPVKRGTIHTLLEGIALKKEERLKRREARNGVLSAATSGSSITGILPGVADGNHPGPGLTPAASGSSVAVSAGEKRKVNLSEKAEPSSAEKKYTGSGAKPVSKLQQRLNDKKAAAAQKAATGASDSVGSSTGGGRSGGKKEESMPLVLFVEDNPVNARIASRVLMKKKFGVDIATDGKMAVERFTANYSSADRKHNIILMDINMPVMDGYEATTVIRKYEEEHGLPRIPIVALTGDSGLECRNQCMAAGCDEFLAKPINYEQLVNTAWRLLRGANK